MTETTENRIYLIQENNYGALSKVKYVTDDKDDAIDKAVEMADGAEYKEDGSGFKSVGHTQKGPTGYLIFEHEVHGHD